MHTCILGPFFLQLKSGPDYLRFPMLCVELKKQDCYWKERELCVGSGDRYTGLRAHAPHSITPNSSRYRDLCQVTVLSIQTHQAKWDIKVVQNVIYLLNLAHMLHNILTNVIYYTHC